MAMIRDVDYNTRDDDEELRDYLDVMKNVHNIFENCNFENISAKNFHDIHFINCTFSDVGSSTFTNCKFDSPKFYDGFRGTFCNCDMSKYSGKIGERNLNKK